MHFTNIENLKNYLANMTPNDRKVFAEKCGTTVGNLNQVIYVNKKCGAGLAIEIEKASKGKISCSELCPGVDFGYLRSQPLIA
ncbi:MULTISPECIES: YdaS family helix-turn-helix protein [Acinetobacter]|uniref:Helix-turn-helix domain-containing protein n=1 Tax=Acinetobacter pollinis TaxID=2605270 RepID=A0ABU6DS52_9GAMM|nr:MULTISPECIES: YdaS family helix-turn-helix protein [Acinetobacter]MBF7694049.1 helix-turn-helix domain-containing protein [Acinetobacter pollinis]MBF7701678.1 helix-turn-helix domain-containing protein [Acinetobacter pollinis]MEB5475954.1 helix-turn-helix domain-containing protein [Acinetobacter pollinis]WEV48129.1 YdaS family helix-turn-helix protein [Acinetobacter sp. ESL0695]